MSGTIATGALTEYGYTAETVFGSTPAGQPFQKIRDVSLSVNLQKETYQSEARSSDRTRQDVRHGYKSVAGEIGGEISEESWDDLLEAVTGGTWVNPTPISTSLVVAVDAATDKITSTSTIYDFVSSGIRTGDVFFVNTTSAPLDGLSNQYLTAVSVSASTIEVEAGTIGTTDASVTIDRIYPVGRKVSTGNTYRSFTIERWLTDRNLYQQFRGVRVNQMTISVPASGLATFSFGILGRDGSSFSASTVASTYLETLQTTPYAAVNGALFEGGAAIGLVTSAEITLNNNMVSPQVAGTDLVPDIIFGPFRDVTGTITVLFNSPEAHQKFVTETESSLVLRLQDVDALDENTKFINVVLPRIKYSGGDIDDSSESGVTVTMPFVALVPLSTTPQFGSAPIFIQASNTVKRTETFNFLAGLPTDWTYSRASNAYYFNSSGDLTIASSGVARIDYDPSSLALRGFLCEPSRTNQIRNNTATGAVAGTPGTAPTNWTVSAGSASVEIVGTGTENGIPYIDIRWFGSGGESTFEQQFESPGFASAAVSQVWTGSAFLKLQAGSLTGFSIFGLRVYETPGTSNTTINFVSSVTNAALNQQRYAVTRTLENAGTTATHLRLAFTPPATAWDFTLRIGAPQLELSPFETSPILTSGTALTRSGDRVTYNLNMTGSWLQSSNGYTYALEYSTPQLTNNGVLLGVAADFTKSNYFSNSGINTSFNHLVAIGGISSDITSLVSPANVVCRIAASINFKNAKYAVNKTVVSQAEKIGYPTMATIAVMSAPWGPSAFAIGHVRSVTLSNYRYTDAELRSITT